MDVTNENAPGDCGVGGGQGKDYTTGMLGKDRPAIHQAFHMYKQIEINHKYYMTGFGKSMRGKFSQAEGLDFIHENVDVIKVKASRILWDGKLVRVRFAPLIYYPVSWVMSPWVNFHPHLSACAIIFWFFFFNLASACLPDPVLQARWSFQTRTLAMMVRQYFCTGVEVTQKSLTVAPVSTGCAVCLQWEWKQPVIHD